MSRRRLGSGVAILALAAISAGRLAGPRPAAPPPLTAGNAPIARILPQLPGRNAGRFGRPGDPLNLLFVGSEAEVRAALTGAGWISIPVPLSSALWAGLRELLHGRAPGGLIPMNGYTLNGRPQDLNWSQPVTWLSSRHHFRMWRSGWKDPRGRDAWWGSANFDRDLRWWDLSHIPDPDTNMERDYIGKTLASSVAVSSLKLVPAPQVPHEGVNDKGYAFRSDGRVLVVDLKRRG